MKKVLRKTKNVRKVLRKTEETLRKNEESQRKNEESYEKIRNCGKTRKVMRKTEEIECPGNQIFTQSFALFTLVQNTLKHVFFCDLSSWFSFSVLLLCFYHPASEMFIADGKCVVKICFQILMFCGNFFQILMATSVVYFMHILLGS